MHNKRTLHTYGDSHGYSGWSNVIIEGLTIMTHDLGPATASGFGFTSESIMDMKNSNVYPGDIICFVMGEIDCRMHIHKYKNEYKEIIDEIVKHYFIGIKNVITVDGLIIMVSSITPVPEDDTYPLDENWMPNGTDVNRRTYVEYMNEKIKEECEKYGYIYFDVYSQYCNERGFLNTSLGDGGVHIMNCDNITKTLKTILKI